MGQHFKAILTQAIAKITRYAVEERIAPGNNDHAFYAKPGAKFIDDLLQVRTDPYSFAVDFREKA